MLTDRNLFSYLLLTSVFVGAYTIAPLLAVKIVSVGPFTLPAGDFIYALTFLCTDLTGEIFGRKYARNIVICGFITLTLVYLGTWIALILPAADFWNQEAAYNAFFGSGLRIFLATMSAYVLSQFLDVFIFGWLKKKTGGRYLWLRNNFSTAAARLVDIIVFVMVAFYGVYDTAELLKMIGSGYAAGLIISLIDTPFVYAGVWLFYRFHPELRIKKLRPVRPTPLPG